MGDSRVKCAQFRMKFFRCLNSHQHACNGRWGRKEKTNRSVFQWYSHFKLLIVVITTTTFYAKMHRPNAESDGVKKTIVFISNRQIFANLNWLFFSKNWNYSIWFAMLRKGQVDREREGVKDTKKKKKQLNYWKQVLIRWLFSHTIPMQRCVFFSLFYRRLRKTYRHVLAPFSAVVNKHITN